MLTQDLPFKTFLDEAVNDGIVPGLQAIVFTGDKILYNGVSGFSTLPSPDCLEGKQMEKHTILWTASCTKLVMSLIVLHIIEKGLAKTGFSVADLDSHEALIEVLPQFKQGSGSLVSKIIDGFEEDLGADGKKVMKLRDVKGKVTLRMLLTHTSGTGYSWNHPLLSQLCWPEDGSIPNNAISIGGAIRDFELPLIFEPGTGYHYGHATDWLGQFAICATGTNLRELFKTIILNPLGISPNEADLWISPELEKNKASIYTRDPGSLSGFKLSLLPVYSAEHGPEEGKAYMADSGLYASVQSYARILQAVLNKDTRIISPELWQRAFKDDLQDRGLKFPRPEWRSTVPNLLPDVDQFAKSTTEDGVGVNLLQCKVATTPTITGRPVGSFAWGGLANTYYFVDPVTGIGAMIGTQIIPFYDDKVIELRDKLERMIYSAM